MDDPQVRATPARGRLLSRTLQRTVLQDMRQHPELAAAVGGVSEARIVGLDPIRVLVLGSGLAVGYGVDTHEEALTGALARAVRGDGSRGVTVLNHSAVMETVEQTVAGLGLVGTPTFHLVVWCPSLFDVMRAPDRGAYRRALLEGIGIIRESARPGARISICELPLPTAPGSAERIARTLVPRFNAAMRRVTAALPGVQVAPTPDFTTLRDPQAFSAGYYNRWAQAIAHPETAQTSLAG